MEAAERFVVFLIQRHETESCDQGPAAGILPAV